MSPAPGMDSALDRRRRASPSGPPAQAPHGVGCDQRPSHEHERPAPRLRVRPFPATNDPAGTTASADFSTANQRLSTPAVPHHPEPKAGHLGHPWRSPRIRPATFIAHPPRLRNGPLMTSGFAVPAGSPGPPRLIRAVHAGDHVFLGSRFRLRLPSHPASRTTQLPSGLWLVSSPPRGTRTPELLVMPGVHNEGPPRGGPSSSSSTSATVCPPTAYLDPLAS